MFGNKDTRPPDLKALTASAEQVKDPVLEETLKDLGWLGPLRFQDSTLTVPLTLPTPLWKGRAELQQRLASALETDHRIEWAHEVKASRPMTQSDLLPGVKNVVLVASGKGGVGKSTVATNLAAAFAAAGAKVGLLDADIYGPSIPTMLGVTGKPEINGQLLQPMQSYGMKLMSIGFIVDAKDAMVWRGPMLNSALTQFMRDVAWGELDYLVIDMPPGTGDIQLTIAQHLKVSGAVLVSTPQDVALADVTRGKVMFDKVEIPVLGVIENMAYFECGECGARHEIFSSGGAGRLAEKLGLPLLGEIPLEIRAREAGDKGKPVVVNAPESKVAHAVLRIADVIATELAEKAQKQTVKPSGLKIIQ